MIPCEFDPSGYIPGAVGVEWSDEAKEAIAIERERCAKIAESYRRGTEPQSSIDGICFLIARDIRGKE